MFVFLVCLFFFVAGGWLRGGIDVFPLVVLCFFFVGGWGGGNRLASVFFALF